MNGPNVSKRGGFWHWPPPWRLAYAIGLGLAETAWFALIYGGAAYFTDRHGYRVALHTAADMAMPLVPAAAILYLSLNVLLWCAPFILRTRRELEGLTAALAVATLAAGIGFVCLPAADAFPAPSDVELGPWAGVFHFAQWLALSHNYFPSLHVAFTTICVAIYCQRASAAGKVLLCGWGLAIVASTLLTHQHYVADVASGLVLGWAAVRWVYRPWLGRGAALATGEMPPANSIRPPEQQV